MELRRVEVSDETAFNAWFDVLRRSDLRRDGTVGQGWHPDEWRARALNRDQAKVWHLLSFGGVGDTPVAIAALEVTRDDNLHWVRAELHVDPTLRRRGFGSSALRHLERYAKDLDRSCLVVTAIEGSREVGRGSNRGFAPRHG